MSRLRIQPEGVLIILIGFGILAISRTFPELPEGYPGPGLFPAGIGILLMVTGGFMSFGGALGKSKVNKGEGNSQALNFVGLLLVVICFPFFYKIGHFFLSLFICISLVGILFRIQWWRSLIISSITCGSIYLLFIQVLRVPL